MKDLIIPHHIDFFKPCSDSMDVILMNKLHRRLSSTVEPRKDLDYYTVMRLMRDSFENIEAPSIWNNKLQDLYYERIKIIVHQWRNNRHIRLLGLTKDVLSVLYKDGSSLITEDFIDKLIDCLDSKIS